MRSAFEIITKLILPKHLFLKSCLCNHLGRNGSDLTEIPPYLETGLAIPLSRCFSCVIADYRCYTPTSFLKDGLSQSKGRPNKGAIAEKACLWSLSLGNENSSQSFSDRSFGKSLRVMDVRAFGSWMWDTKRAHVTSGLPKAWWRGSCDNTPSRLLSEWFFWEKGSRHCFRGSKKGS